MRCTLCCIVLKPNWPRLSLLELVQDHRHAQPGQAGYDYILAAEELGGDGR